MTKEPNKGGAPLGNTNAAKEVTSSRKNIRLYPADEATIAALIAAGYEADRSKVMRRAIKEAMEPKVGTDICPYCGSNDMTDLFDPHAPEGAPDMIQCETCGNRWEGKNDD